MMRLLRTWLMIVTCLVVAAPVFAAPPQTAIDDEVDGAKRLYQDGRLQEAIDALRAVIVKLNALRDARDRTRPLADAHLHLGLAYLAMRNESAAVENFRQVAALDPNRILDPQIYSPRVLSVFESARSDVIRTPTPAVPGQPQQERAGANESGIVPLVPGSEPLLRILPGTKVRVERTGPRFVIEGQLITVNEKLMTIGASDWRVDLQRETLTRVQMVTARKNHWIPGMLVGAGLGLLIGALETPGCEGNDGDCYTRGENMGYASVGMGLVGGLIGALYKTDQWTDVPLNQGPTRDASSQRPSVTFAARRATFSFSW